MTLSDLINRVWAYQAERGQQMAEPDHVESVELDARRSLADLPGAYFSKNVTVAIVAGVASLTGQTDILYHRLGRVYYDDASGTLKEVSMLTYPHATTAELNHKRVEMSWGELLGVLENNAIYVKYGDAVSVPADANLVCDFGFVQTLALWPVQYEPHLVERVVQMLASAKKN